MLSGSVIKNAVIGDYFVCNENAVIGSEAFTMTSDEHGNRYRIPSLGKVIIGDYVEIGANNNITCGSCGDTIIGDYVKLDALIHIAHDTHLENNVEITAGAILGGFAEAGEGAYIGLNACLRNRIRIGEGALIGMGSTVTKNIAAHVTAAGNPARLFNK